MASALFVLLVQCLGGFSGNDTFESVFSTWAIGHGQVACAFPKGFRVTAPLYPLVSGGIVAIAHVGHTVPFPPRRAMGSRCDRAFIAINTWSAQARVLVTTLRIAYLGWLVLLAGAVSLLRATGRGRRGWEPATVIVLACLPPVWTCVESTFHPEDLMAMGFALAATACALRGSWRSCGVLIALACLSQQYALLVAVPLLVVAPRNRRVAYGAAAAITLAAIALPLSVFSAGSATHSIFFGTGSTGGIGGSFLSDLGLHGTPLLILSRITPLVLTAIIAWWAVRATGPAAFGPVALVSLVAVSLSLRLVFEQQIFEYYFMALSVSLLLLDVVRGQVRRSLIAWLIVVPTAFVGEIVLPGSLGKVVPWVAVGLALLALIDGARTGRTPGQLLPWAGVLAAALLTWQTTWSLPAWFWQAALVIPGVVLAARPLLAEVRRGGTPLPAPERRPVATATVISPPNR